MIKTSIDIDLVRLRQFLTRLEADAQIAVGDVDLGGQEIESLKREIAYIEGILNGDPRCGSRAFLFQIPIDFGSTRRALESGLANFSALQLIARADTTKVAIGLSSAFLDSKRRFQAAMAMLSNANVL